nr:hypothetical protein Iba_chr03bCG5890 [Ipomoea batatas]
MSQQSSICGNRSSPSSLQPSSTPPRSREPRRKVSPAQHPALPPITPRHSGPELQKRTMAGKEVAGEGFVGVTSLECRRISSKRHHVSDEAADGTETRNTARQISCIQNHLPLASSISFRS